MADSNGPGGTAWGEVDLEDGKTVTRRLGELTLWLRRVEGETWVAHGRTAPQVDGPAPGSGPPPSGAAPPAGAPEEPVPEWTRWAHGGQAPVVHLEPMLPDRLLVVSPEVPFHLAPGANARVYVRIPLWARVTSHDEDLTLAEAPTVVLSDTWWGHVAEGELGYWLRTKARRRISDDIFEDHLAICPLSLSNRSHHGLPVESFAIRVAHLGLFREGTKLWGSETRVVYENDEEGSQIEIVEGAPSEAGQVEPASPPRQRAARGFRALTFRRFH